MLPMLFQMIKQQLMERSVFIIPRLIISICRTIPISIAKLILIKIIIIIRISWVQRICKHIQLLMIFSTFEIRLMRWINIKKIFWSSSFNTVMKFPKKQNTNTKEK